LNFKGAIRDVTNNKNLFYLHADDADGHDSRRFLIKKSLC